MSNENTIGREPVELVELILPKCSNKFGCHPCQAGLGDVFSGRDVTPVFSEGIGVYTGSNVTVTQISGGVNVVATTVDPQFRPSAYGGLGLTPFSGDDYRYVVVHGKWNAGASHSFEIYWSNTAGNNPGATTAAIPVNFSTTWRGVRLDSLKAGDEFVAVWDMADSSTYATMWQGHSIDALRFDFANDINMDVDVYSIQVCDENLFEARGSECYNTRATCVDVDAYRDTPDRNKTADLIKDRNETINSSELTRNDNLFAAFDVRFGSEPDGIIWEQGDALGVYLGVDGGNLVFEARTTTPSVDLATVSVDVAPYIGANVTLYVELIYVATTSVSITLWVYDPVELTLTRLGSDSLTTDFTDWATTNGGAIGTGNDVIGANRTDADWNGAISGAYFYESQTAPWSMSQEGFRSRVMLGDGNLGEPRDTRVFPCLLSTGSIGTRINLSGSDDNYQPLGRRAVFDFGVSDFVYSDIATDPYHSSRLHDPRQKSTFWRKFLARQKFGVIGSIVKRHIGYSGQALSDYQTTTYIFDKVTQSENELNFHCRDVLTRTEFRKAQIPKPSSGSLGTDVNASATSFTMVGDFTEEYPASGTLRINDEIMTYTSIAAAGSPVETTVSGLTRGTDGSTANSHEETDLVQLCRRYTNATITEVLGEWFFDDSSIPGQLVDYAEIEDEVTNYLDAYSLTTLITEPTGVDTLIGRLSLECSFYVFWDERSQKIRMKAIRAVDVPDVVANWTYEENIVGGSFKVAEYPKQRLNVINFYYNPIDFSGDLSKQTNFKNGLKLINGLTSSEEQHGGLVQSKDIYSIFLSVEAQANQTTSRLAIRYSDVPKFAEFHVDAKDRNVGLAEIVTISHPALVDKNGERDVRRWMIIETEESQPGHVAKYIAADITLDGRIYRITDNTYTTYNADDFNNGLFFITDNDGLNPDGSRGSTIN